MRKVKTMIASITLAIFILFINNDIIDGMLDPDQFSENEMEIASTLLSLSDSASSDEVSSSSSSSSFRVLSPEETVEIENIFLNHYSEAKILAWEDIHHDGNDNRWRELCHLLWIGPAEDKRTKSCYVIRKYTDTRNPQRTSRNDFRILLRRRRFECDLLKCRCPSEMGLSKRKTNAHGHLKTKIVDRLVYDEFITPPDMSNLGKRLKS